MKILVIGGTGMLGHKLVQRWQERFEVWCTIRGDFERVEPYQIFQEDRTITNVDIENFEELAATISDLRPEVIFNAVGVVKQLPTASEAVTAITINALLPHKLAEAAKRTGARLITISTDCVFDGSRGGRTEEDHPDAADLYGKSKELGEVTDGNALTLRTSIIGRELGTAHGLVEWFLSNRGGRVQGFANAIYSGFPTLVLADIIGDIIETRPELTGLYHVASEPIDKFTLLELVNDAYNADVTIERNEDFRIDRSLNADRFNAAAGFSPRPWNVMINEMAGDDTPYDSFSR